MSGSSRVRRGPAERLGAWVATGPPGHLWSVLGDLVVLWARWGLAKARGRG